MQTFRVQPASDLVVTPDRRLLTALPRGAGRATEIRCAACGALLAVGHRPDDPALREVLVRCAGCRTSVDLSAATLGPAAVRDEPRAVRPVAAGRGRVASTR